MEDHIHLMGGEPVAESEKDSPGWAIFFLLVIAALYAGFGWLGNEGSPSVKWVFTGVAIFEVLAAVFVFVRSRV